MSETTKAIRNTKKSTLAIPAEVPAIPPKPRAPANMATSKNVKAQLIINTQPKVKSRKTKRYITEVKNWGINSYKWKYARSCCEKRKWNFTLITEKDLF